MMPDTFTPIQRMVLPPKTAPTIPMRPTATALGGSVPPVTAPPSIKMAPKTPLPEAPTLSVLLTALAEVWPDSIRHEIVRLNLLDARVAMPADLVEASLKRGRVVFSWKTVRSWIRPAGLAAASSQDDVELELPLKVIAPLFISRKNAELAKGNKVEIDEAIPNLFFGFPKPEAQQGVAAGTTTDSNYYVFDDTAETAYVDPSTVKRKGPSGTEFIAKCATPNEIVSRAAAIDGVAGALVALPDGLMVASRIPQELNGDTLAAFLPQIFAKVATTTRELRMGELNNLSFTVGNVPWKIFRVNAIFFAAFGRAGEGMNTGQLAALAAELDRKNK
jgi:predicted regulator of Ras-like GTPase activity (Roadblock/LC7/MglB family)